MTSVARTPSTSIEWQSVSSRHPCRVCGKTRGCHFQADDAFVCCVNRPSEWPLTTGAWLHRTERRGCKALHPTKSVTQQIQG